jgi:hypothetical protein
MRKVALTSVVAALVLGLIGVVSVAAASQGGEPSRAKPRTLAFDVAFSPFTLAATNNVRDPNSPFAVGDVIAFHDQLSSNGKRVGDDLGSCVIVEVTPDVLGNCTLVIRLPDGNIAAQFATVPGPAPKEMALTGGTGAYRNAGGEGTLVEFGASTGTLTLHVLSLAGSGRGD